MTERASELANERRINKKIEMENTTDSNVAYHRVKLKVNDYYDA